MSSDGQGTNNTPQIGSYQCTELIESISKKSYLNAKTADVHFSFALEAGTVKRIPAHKSVLAAGSDAFEAMFYGDLREKGDVHLTDASEAAFMEFLQFFYLTEVKLTIDNIAGVMYLGNKYHVPTCISTCVRFLRDVLSIDNIFIGLNLAILYDHHELKKICETFIVLNTAEVLQSNDFMECDRQMLAHILNMNVLSCIEVEVFKACMSWVRAKSKQNTLTKAMVKKHLGDLFHEIRFKSMTMQELCSLQTEYGSVFQSNFVTIASMIVQPGHQPEKFNNQPRHATWNSKAIVKCDRVLGTELTPYKMPAEFKTIFSSNKPLLLGSFTCVKVGVFGTSYRDLRSDLPVNLEITETGDLNGTNPKSILKMMVKLESKDTIVALPHPILIKPRFFYEICIGPFPDYHCYFSPEMKTEVYLDSNVTIQFYRCRSADKDGKIIDLIPVLNFNSI